MDVAGQIPEDLLLDVLGRLPPRSLAVSRSVCKDWRAAVDGHRLLCTDLLPLSLDGVFLYQCDYIMFGRVKYHLPQLFSRRSTQRRMPAVGYHTAVYRCGMEDCCNGLLLLSSQSHVFNPATMEWARLPRRPRSAYPKLRDRRYLVFDPAVSMHYEVVSVPGFPWYQRPTGHVYKDVRTDRMVFAMEEWPPTLYIMHVYSSKTNEWKQRSFAREGEAVPTLVDFRANEPYLQNYAAYWHGALYVPCGDNLVVRIDLSHDKYQIVKLPEGKRERSHATRLGKSEKGVYCAFCYARNAFQIWFLVELPGRMEWVLKNDINFDVVPERSCTIVGGSWILQGDGNNEELVEDNSEWDPSNENVVSVEAWVGMPGPSAMYEFLGFHPYKEIVLFAANGSVMAYHLSTSQVRDLGYSPTWSYQIEACFPYMPCWTGPLPGSN